MSDVKFSSDFLAGSSDNDQTGSLMARMVGLGLRSLGGGSEIAFMGAGDAGASYDNLGILRLMSGTRPAMSSITANTAPAGTTILWEARALGQLSSTSNTFRQAPNSWYLNPAVFSTVLVAATAAGTASWFWFLTVAANSIGTISTNTVYHNITGTVGTVGSGADMIMASTTVAVGQFIRMNAFKIKFPTLMSL